MYYSVFGTIVTLFVGVLASWLVKCTDEHQYNLNLLHPLVRKFIRTSESYASNEILNDSVCHMKRKSTVYIIYDADGIANNSTKPTDSKYTRNIVI